ncbi:MAG: efflux RND transporter periplasmic adaptor subunit [Chloroflexota bacterium]
MGTSTLPRRRGLSRRWLVIAILLVAAGAVVYFLANARGTETPAPATVAVTRGTLVATVAGSGSIAAEQSLNLAFQANGTVAAVLIKEGDAVTAGQVLARLDDRNLLLQAASAQASLDSAKARLEQAQGGNARPEDLAAARAGVASAQASYDKVARGASAADLAAAQAAVSSAQANYDKVAGGGAAPDLAAAEAAVASAQAAHDAAVRSSETTSSQLLAARANLEKADAAKLKAQAAYDKVAWEPDIAMRPEALALQNATIDYVQAKANYDALSQTAGTDAQSKVDAAAAQLAQAQANLAKLAPRSEDVMAAKASLDQAQANLAKLAPRSEDVRAAKASLDQAQANLAKLTAAGTSTDLQIQQAAVAQAEQALKQAELAVDNATLRAPFAGIVAQVSVVPGATATSASPALKLINRNPLHVDLRLSENDVAKVQLGQPVRIAVPSLGDWATDGRVIFVAPAAENVSGVVTYVARVSFSDSEPKVKVGMTADLSIEVARKESVLLVPNTTLLPKGTGRVVQVPDASAAPTGSAGPAVREVDVQTGLSDGTSTEILSGLDEGQQVIALPDSGVRPSGPGSLFGG